MNEFKGKNVTVMGLARSGQAVATLLSDLGAQVFGSDNGDPERLAGVKAELTSHGVTCELGQHTAAVYQGQDLIVLSPGIPLTVPILREARSFGVPILSEIEVAYRLTRATVIGITGTNGKTTTTSLLGALLKTAGHEVAVAGNIGQAVSKYATRLSDKGLLVVELSSFQLETIERFRPHIALLLNITPDHLDRYVDMDKYIAAKQKIFKNQKNTDFAVVNADDSMAWTTTMNIAARRVPFSLSDRPASGPYFDTDTFYLRRDGQTQTICSTDELRLKGPHNWQNIMAALTAANLLNVPLAAMRKTLLAFRGLEHRIEFVTEKNGVAFYNDSKATTVESTRAAVRSFERVVLIMGGLDKGTAYEPLFDAVRERVTHLILIGQAAPKIDKALHGATETTFADTLDEAVQKAASVARSGDVVLLSPACASYDMFKNYEERGRRFMELVNTL